MLNTDYIKQKVGALPQEWRQGAIYGYATALSKGWEEEGTALLENLGVVPGNYPPNAVKAGMRVAYDQMIDHYGLGEDDCAFLKRATRHGFTVGDSLLLLLFMQGRVPAQKEKQAFRVRGMALVHGLIRVQPVA